jgi:hypothetical protein
MKSFAGVSCKYGKVWYITRKRYYLIEDRPEYFLLMKNINFADGMSINLLMENIIFAIKTFKFAAIK